MFNELLTVEFYCRVEPLINNCEIKQIQSQPVFFHHSLGLKGRTQRSWRDEAKREEKRREVPKTRLAFQTRLSGAAFKQTADCAGNHILNTCLHRGAFCLTKLVDNHFINLLTKTEEVKL